METRRGWRRLATMGAAAVVLAGGTGAAVAVERTAGHAAQVPATVDAAAPAKAADRATTAPGPRTVQPYQPVGIGQGAVMALLPEGRQNYVVAWTDVREAVEQAREMVGDDIRPESLSGGISIDGADVLYTGAWRTSTPPARITVRTADGAERDAGVLSLPGRPGWGTYYLDAAGSGTPQGTVTVTAYGPDGEVLATLAYEMFPTGR
ncbi:hypothetical protein [Streptomyces sp. MJP52]|uniref:hypothetical protein n=1 Tax=Streptomyces sp. MJP52 TaxID=2940555 RepID=UPI0024771375|nr:hypothetical protein [Streptomyces sp. MJP52]MDH6229332.1 hypothetical protein [Streptomyces sp. MJP52]